jgi:DNA replication ATP-dependent helicase Dna2
VYLERPYYLTNR